MLNKGKEIYLFGICIYSVWNMCLVKILYIIIMIKSMLFYKIVCL